MYEELLEICLETSFEKVMDISEYLYFSKLDKSSKNEENIKNLI